MKVNMVVCVAGVRVHLLLWGKDGEFYMQE